MYKWLIILLLTGCSNEIYDYEIKKAYAQCNQQLYSVMLTDHLTFYANCSDGKKFILKRE